MSRSIPGNFWSFIGILKSTGNFQETFDIIQYLKTKKKLKYYLLLYLDATTSINYLSVIKQRKDTVLKKKF